MAGAPPHACLGSWDEAEDRDTVATIMRRAEVEEPRRERASERREGSGHKCFAMLLLPKEEGPFGGKPPYPPHGPSGSTPGRTPPKRAVLQRARLLTVAMLPDYALALARAAHASWLVM